MKRLWFPILFLACMALPLHATHNRAGEITLTQLDELTYQINITTFTYTLSQADRDDLEVQWGDNTFSYAPRVELVKLPNYYQKNVYITQHTFPGPGVYEIVVQDPNRNDGVKKFSQFGQCDLLHKNHHTDQQRPWTKFHACTAKSTH